MTDLDENTVELAGYEEDPDLDEDPDIAEPDALAEPEPRLCYPTMEAWLTDWLAEIYRRAIQDSGEGRTWCREWWRHGEAIARLEALWRAWEHLRHDGALGMSIWWRDHADHHLTVLQHPDGPFKGCTLERGHRDQLPPIPLAPAPDGWFTEPNV